jgi:hypothetical protein
MMKFVIARIDSNKQLIQEYIYIYIWFVNGL